MARPARGRYPSGARTPGAAAVSAAAALVCRQIARDPRGAGGAMDQSNSVASLDDRYVLKLFRRIEAGPNPELEIGRLLAERGFDRTPRLEGALEYLRSGVESATLGIVQAAVRHQGSGW